MQFMVLAYDGTDEGALERRLKVREEHLAGARRMYEDGSLIKGGAILDDDGKMIGSAAFMEFDTREALDAWLQSDPYVTGGVWQDITVKAVKLA
jgi:hypothetical protein